MSAHATTAQFILGMHTYIIFKLQLLTTQSILCMYVYCCSCSSLCYGVYVMHIIAGLILQSKNRTHGFPPGITWAASWDHQSTVVAINLSQCKESTKITSTMHKNKNPSYEFVVFYYFRAA